MEHPFYIIESRMQKSETFKVMDGRQPTHALFYMKEGSFSVQLNGKTETVNPGDCVIFPDDMDFRRRITKPLLFVYIQFATNFHCPFALRLTGGKVEWKNKSEQRRFKENIRSFEQIIDRTDKKSSYLKEHLLLDMLIQIESRESAKKDGTRLYFKDPLVCEAVEWMNAHIGEKMLVRDICLAVGSNPSTLNFRFRKETDRSVIRYLTELRMKKARYLLRCSSYSVGSIAEKCGFDNIYFFSNTFKKCNGVSPLEYRNG